LPHEWARVSFSDNFVCVLILQEGFRKSVQRFEVDLDVMRSAMEKSKLRFTRARQTVNVHEVLLHISCCGGQLLTYIGFSTSTAWKSATKRLQLRAKE